MPRRALVTLTVKGWTGWTPEQPPARSQLLEVTRGASLTPASVQIPSEPYAISVEAIGPDRITVTFSGMVMENPDGTIPLSAPPSGRCMIQLRRCMRLATPTLDGGTLLSLTLERIVEPTPELSPEPPPPPIPSE